MSYFVKLLLVTHDTDALNKIQTISLSNGYDITCVSSPQDAVAILQPDKIFDLVIFDADIVIDEDDSYIILLGSIGKERFCLMTNSTSKLESFQFRRSAYDRVLTKPVQNEDLQRHISEQMEKNLSQIVIYKKEYQTSPQCKLEELSNNRFFLAASPTMISLYKEIRLLAPINIPVLLLGESGVGKEIVAMLLHKYHCQTEQTFLNVNCAALPNDLLESELFGYEAGAFTGAMKSKPGKFELANKGTLLLDEIGEMSPQMQAKLLHVLQDGSFTRLGARNSTKVDVRILAATNIDIQKGIIERRFREDLYYRLNTFTLTIPPLRDRREEIPLLVKEMAARGSSELCKQMIFSDSLIEAAQDYSWPGNLRELRNFVMRTLILQDQRSAYQDLRAKTGKSYEETKQNYEIRMNSASHIDEFVGMKGKISDVKNKTEVRLLSDALTASGWNRRKAAAKLNISYRSLLYKIQQHGLSA